MTLFYFNEISWLISITFRLFWQDNQKRSICETKILHLIFNSFRFQFYTPPWTNVRIFYYFLFYSLCVSWYKNIFVESANFIHNNTSQRDWPAWLHNWIRETGWSDYLVCVGMSLTDAQNLLNLYIYYITIWAKWRELSTVRYDK